MAVCQFLRQPKNTCLEDISKHLSVLRVLKSTCGPLSLRRALRLSQAELGRLLGKYGQHRPYTPETLSLWERPERAVAMPRKYQMADRARLAYWEILVHLVQLRAGDRYRLRGRQGPRRWRFQLEGDCANCRRPFRVRRAGARRCGRCQVRRRRPMHFPGNEAPGL